ncbi:sensor histidine kinase [Brachybacterium sp.]|uniref:sensor histidine kinase n=1 Tax=Brachybacterium sp. TaxID=1891286 RepID=UPI002ED08EC6
MEVGGEASEAALRGAGARESELRGVEPGGTEPRGSAARHAAPDPHLGSGETERIVGTILGVLPYGLLVVCVLASLLLGPAQERPLRVLPVLALSLAAGAWTALVIARHRAGRGSAARRALDVLVLQLLAAALVLLAPWFAVFAFLGYLYSYELLGSPWRYLGVAVTSATMAVTYLGGIDRVLTGHWALWLGVTVVSTVMAAIFYRLVDAMDLQLDEQRRALARIAESNRRLESALAENAQLHAQLLVQAREAGVQQERERLAREIHDTLAQDLAGILTQLQGVEDTLEDSAATRRRVGIAAGLAREGLVEARRSVRGVGPALLASTQLPLAVEGTARRWAARHGAEIDPRVVGDPRALREDIETAVLRGVQEGLANVAAHARAQHVGLTLTYMDDLVTLDVRDDGIGFDPTRIGVGDSEPEPAADGTGEEGFGAEAGRRPGDDAVAAEDGHGYGLTGMRRRVQRLAGHVAIESAPGEGTVVAISLPAIPAEGPTEARGGEGS